MKAIFTEPAEEITEERIKEGIEDALADGKGYFVGIHGYNGVTLKMKYDGNKVALKIGRTIFECESLDELELIDRFIGCVLSRYYN